MNAQQNLKKLQEQLRDANLASRIAANLEWDQQTQTPPDGQPGMAQKKSLMEKLAHQFLVTDEIGHTLLELQEQKCELGEAERLLVDRLLYSYQRETVLPAEFVEKKSLITSAALTAWGQAKDAKDFSIFAPHLQKVIEITRERALLYGGKDGDNDSMYTALLGIYEPGMTTQRLREILNGVRQWLVIFIQKIMETPGKRVDETLAEKVLTGIFPKNRQRRLSETLLRTIGYDLNWGNLAETRHPFSVTVGESDHRVTTHFVENQFNPAFFATGHEAGHALFAHGALRQFDWADNPSSVVSMGIHESQSRMWENIVCRGKPFWLYFYPILQSAFPQYYEVNLDDFLKAINTVKPSPTRIYADEVTYNLHIILRFEIETDLLSGELSVNDLPEVFARKMNDYLWYSPKDVVEGCLQDIHFALGYTGYFPSYTLGNLAAAQLFAKFGEVNPGWSDDFSHGKFGTLLGWLRKEVHPLGYFETLDDLLTRVTGEPLNPEHWFRYIEGKFGPLYQLPLS